MSSYSRQQLEEYLKTLEINCKRVCDIGGSANPVKNRVKSWEVKQYDIVDNENEKTLHEKWTQPTIYADINKRWDITNYYDVVFMIEVSEYLYDPYQALNNIYKMLKKGGKAIVSFHWIYPQHEPIDNDYLRYTPSWIKKASKEIGFRDITMLKRELQSPEIYHNLISAERMRPSKKSYHNLQGFIAEVKK